MSMYSIGWVVHPGGVLDGDDALVGGLVRERGAGDEVADRVDARGAGAHRAVDLDQAALAELDAGRVEAEGFDVGAAPGGDHEPVSFAGLATGFAAGAAVGELDARLARLDVVDQRVGVDLDPLFLEPALDELGDVGVLGRQHAVERLEQQHLAAEARVGGGDLRARGAGADDGERARQLGERPGLLGADHAAAEVDARDRPLAPSRSRAGSSWR